MQVSYGMQQSPMPRLGACVVEYKSLMICSAYCLPRVLESSHPPKPQLTFAT